MLDNLKIASFQFSLFRCNEDYGVTNCHNWNVPCLPKHLLASLLNLCCSSFIRAENFRMGYP